MFTLRFGVPVPRSALSSVLRRNRSPDTPQRRYCSNVPSIPHVGSPPSSEAAHSSAAYHIQGCVFVRFATIALPWLPMSHCSFHLRASATCSAATFFQVYLLSRIDTFSSASPHVSQNAIDFRLELRSFQRQVTPCYSSSYRTVTNNSFVWRQIFLKAFEQLPGLDECEAVLRSVLRGNVEKNDALQSFGFRGMSYMEQITFCAIVLFFETRQEGGYMMM